MVSEGLKKNVWENPNISLYNEIQMFLCLLGQGLYTVYMVNDFRATFEF